MIHVFYSCQVRDAAAWKAALDRLFQERKSAGELDCRIFHAHGAEDRVLAWFEWDSAHDAESFFGSATWQLAQREAGARDASGPMLMDELRALHLTAAD